MNHLLRWLSWLLLGWELVLADPAQAQPAPTYRWVRTGGGPGLDQGLLVALDGAGNAYVAGRFEQTATFGLTTLVSQGDWDVFLAKYDPQGQLLWVRGVGGPGYDYVNGLAVDAAGNACIAGYFAAPAGSTGSAGSAGYVMRVGPLTLTGGTGYAEMYVAKFDPQGSVQWARQTVGPAVSSATALALDRGGNVYVTGKTDKQSQFEGQYPVFSANNPSGTYVAKYDAQGALRWVKTGFGSNTGYSEQLAAEASGQLYVVSYDPRFPTTGPAYSETLLSKLAADGRLLWQKALTNSNSNSILAAEKLLLDAQGNLLLGGELYGIVSLGGQTLTAQGLNDVLLLRLSPQGDFLWAKQLSGNKPTYPDHLSGLGLDTFGNIYTSVGLPDTGTPPPPGRFVGSTLHSFRPDGTPRWERPGPPRAIVDLAVTPRGDVLLTGEFDPGETIDGQLLASAGDEDTYVARLAGPELAEVPPLPNIITPNGDGLNDAFLLPALPAGPWQLRVFSRWGTEVYQAADYQQDWTAPGLSAGLYFYQLTASGQPPVRGWLEIVR